MAARSGGFAFNLTKPVIKRASSLQAQPGGHLFSYNVRIVFALALDILVVDYYGKVTSYDIDRQVYRSIKGNMR